MKIIKEYYIELILFVLCFANLVGAGIPQPLLYFPIIVLACIRLPIPCFAFMCLNFLKDVNHAFFFFSFHISGIAPLTVLVGLLVMRDFITKNIQKLLSRGKPLWIIIAYLLASFVLAGNYTHSSGKTTTLLTTSILSFMSFAYILYNRKKCDFYIMAIYSALLAIFLMQLNIDANHYSHLHSITDFGFYRQEIGADMYEELASSGISYATHYQFYGAMVSMCITLLFANTIIVNSEFILLSILSLIAIGYTGARQYLVIIGLLFSIYVLLSRNSVLFKTSFIVVAISIGSFIVYHSMLSEYFMVVEENGIFGGTGRGTTIDRGLVQFKENPILGVGFGGYNYYGDYKAYPHNLFVEMLAELGALGTMIIFSVAILYKKSLRYLNNKKLKFVGFYIVISFFLRSMVSLSLSQNIVLFASYFALPFAANSSRIANSFKKNIISKVVEGKMKKNRND